MNLSKFSLHIAYFSKLYHYILYGIISEYFMMSPKLI